MPDESALRRVRPTAAAIALAIGTAATLAHGESPPPRVALCAACHGSDGNSTVAGSPSLAAQPSLFLENQLVIIRDGLRDIPAMKGVLDGVDDAELVQLARYYASQPAKPTRTAVDAERAKRGAALAQRALCGTCHLPDYSGRDQIPRLARQREDYLLHSMRQFRSGVTPGRDTIMSAALHGLADAELVDLAHYFATID